MEYQGFSERVKGLIRDFGGDTDQGFADFLGLSKTTVFRWRTGDTLPDGASLILIAQKCNISIDALLLGEGDMFLDEGNSRQPLFIAAEGLDSYNPKAPTEQDRRLLELANEIAAVKKRLDIIEKFIMSIDVGPQHTIK